MSEGGSTAWKVVSLVFFSGRYVTFPSGKTLSPRPVDQTNRLQVIQADAEDDDAEWSKIPNCGDIDHCRKNEPLEHLKEHVINMMLRITCFILWAERVTPLS